MVEHAGQVVGLLALARDDRAAQPLLRLAASPYNDLADVMVLPGHGVEVALASIEALQSLAADGFNVELEDLDPQGALAAADPDRRLLRWQPGSIAPTIDLCDDEPSISRKRQRDWDRLLRRLQATHRVEFHFRQGAATIAILPEFMLQRDARLRALRRNLSLSPPALTEAAIRALAPMGRCAIAEMNIDGMAVARDLYLLDDTVAMLWLRALDMGWLRHSCGHLLLRDSAEHLTETGYKTLDLGRGNEPYKFSLGAQERLLLNAGISGHDANQLRDAD